MTHGVRLVLAALLLGTAPAAPAAGAQVHAAPQDARGAMGRKQDAAPEVAPLERRVTLRLENVPLVQAIQAIDRAADLRLAYTEQVLDGAGRVSVNVRGVTAGEALATVLAGTGVVVRASPRGALSLQRERAPAGSGAASADTAPGSVYGRITDAETGQVLGRVVVVIQDSTVSVSGFSTDGGRYGLRGVPPGEHVIRARRLGYKATQRTVLVTSGRPVQVDMALTANASRLQEVVSTATGPRRKLELGSDITIIDADSIVRTQPVASVIDLLEGRVPGMVIQRTSGAPGDPARIRLRGAGSPNLSNDPIVIVDGVRVYSSQSGARGSNLATADFAAPSPLDYLDPNNIETIEVVKGPSAATLYGQDAANGVILITTKKGRPGPTRWTASAERGMTEMAGEYPELMLRWGHLVSEDRNVFCPIRIIGGGSSGDPCLADSTVRFQMLNDPELTVLDQGSRTAATLGVYGGTDALTYNLTGSYRDETGLVRLPAYAVERYRLSEGRDVPDWMERPQNLAQWGAASRLLARLGPKASVSLSANLSRTEQQRSSLEQQLGSLMSTFLDRSSGIYYTGNESGRLSEVGETLESFHRRVRAVATQFTNGASLDWRPFSWLTTTADAGINIVQRADEDFVPTGFADVDGHMRSAQGTSVTNTVNVRALAAVPVRGGFRLQLATGINYTGESVEDLTGGFSALAEGTEAPRPDADRTLSRRRADQATFGWYVEPQLSHSRFWLSTGLRLDGGNTFGTRVKLPAFPKLSLSYLISDEPFFPWKELVPVLRLRVAYGQAGRQPGPVDRLRLYGATTPIWTGDQFVNGFELDKIGNTMLEPERTEEIEGGFDTDLLDSRLTLSFTGWRKRTRDALMSVPVPPSIYGNGVSTLENIGVVLNEGLEASIGAELVRSDPVTWGVQVGLVQQRNEVVELGRGVEPFYTRGNNSEGGTRVAAGYPIYGRWIRPLLGYTDANDDGVLASDEIVYGDTAVFVGGTLPEYQATVHTTLRMLRGAVMVSAGFLYENGMTQHNAVGQDLAAFTAGWNDPNASLAEQARTWDQTGFSWVQTTSTLRFNTLAVTYNLPSNLARRAGARSMALSLMGSNLGIRTNYRGIDPNVNGIIGGSGVLDTGVLPRPRTWQVRLNATY